MSVRARTTLVTVLFLVFASLLLSFISYRIQRQNLLAESRRRMDISLSLLSELCKTPLRRGDIFVLAQIADDSARGQPERVLIADRNGLILADSAHRDYDTTNSVIQAARRSSKPVVTRTGGQWQASSPVFDDFGRLVGLVYVVFSTRPVDQALRQALITVTSFAIVSILLGGLVAYMFGKYLSNSFNPLLWAIRRTANGDLSSRAEPVGVSELDEISHAYNRMSQLVSSRVNQLETLNKIAINLSTARTVEDFTESLGDICGLVTTGSCKLLMGDPRTGLLRLVGGHPPLRHVTDACLAPAVIQNRRVYTIGTRSDRKPGTQVAEDYKPESAIVAPLITPDNETLGLLSVDFDPNDEPSPGREVTASIEAISIMIAPMLSAVQRGQAQERAVDALREILLPETPPQPEGIELSATYEVAEKLSGFGGDYYDILQLGEGLWGFAIGDVSGKGLKAGRYTAMAKYAIRSFLLEYRSPLEAVRHANAALTAQMTEETVFLTLFLAVVDTTTGKMAYCNAGHLPALRYSSSSDTVEEVTTEGMAMGLREDAEYGEGTVSLEQGDIVVLYTDGLIEARRAREQYGVEHLQSILKANAHTDLKEAGSAIIDDVREYADAGLQDDIALLMLRIRGRIDRDVQDIQDGEMGRWVDGS